MYTSLDNRTQCCLEMFKSGMSIKEISDGFGISRMRVYQLLNGKTKGIRTGLLARKIQLSRKLQIPRHNVMKFLDVSRSTYFEYLKRPASGTPTLWVEITSKDSGVQPGLYEVWPVGEDELYFVGLFRPFRKISDVAGHVLLAHPPKKAAA